MTVVASRSKAAGLFKFGLAAVAAAALTFTGLSPAFAGETQLGPADIAGFEDGNEGTAGYNYDQWHIGEPMNPDVEIQPGVEESLTFNNCSVTTLAPFNEWGTQVLKGFPVDARPSSIEDIRSLIESLSIDVEEGTVTFQIPMFWHEPEASTYFTTFRDLEGFSGAGTHSLTLETSMTDSSDEIEQSLADFFNELEAAAATGTTFELLGLGFTGAAGTEVNSFGFGGQTYLFGTGDCLTPEDNGGQGGNVNPGDDAKPATPAAPKAPVRVDTGL